MASQWYPSRDQVDTPDKVQSTLKQILDLHYGLQNEHNDLKRRVAAMPLPAASGSASKGNTSVNPPATSTLLGLPVGPLDTTRLANGAKLTYVAATRSFQFM